MITNNGKEIISKYLLGQVPAYATHLAIGCGAIPLDANDPLPANLAAKTVMDFEMLRVPISSKGFVDSSILLSITQVELDSLTSTATITTSIDHDVNPGETIIVSGINSTFDGQYSVIAVTANTISYTKISNSSVLPTPADGDCIVARTKISLTAELPTDNRYKITEISLWSAASNSLAGSADSRILFNFSSGWQTHDNVISDPPTLTSLGQGTLDIVDDGYKAFYALTGDPIFQDSVRQARKEGPRYLNKSLMIRGDLSTIDFNSIDDDWTASGTHVHLNGVDLNISNNNVSDIFKLAFSLVDQQQVVSTGIDDVRILIEFYKAEVNTTSGYAKAQIYLPWSSFDDSYYQVPSFTISQNIDPSNTGADPNLPYMRFYTSPDFSASEIRIARIFVSIMEDSAPSSTKYLAFDGFRLENTTENPIYKMSGYSVIRNDGSPIIKFANTNNYIDFRFALGIS